MPALARSSTGRQDHRLPARATTRCWITPTAVTPARLPLSIERGNGGLKARSRCQNADALAIDQLHRFDLAGPPAKLRAVLGFTDLAPPPKMEKLAFCSHLLKLDGRAVLGRLVSEPELRRRWVSPTAVAAGRCLTTPRQQGLRRLEAVRDHQRRADPAPSAWS